MTAAQKVLNSALGWIPNWVGFVLIILAGVFLIVGGFIAADPRLTVWGVVAIASSILAWADGALSRPKFTFDPKTFGGVVSNVDGWVWAVIFLLFLAAAIFSVLIAT